MNIIQQYITDSSNWKKAFYFSIFGLIVNMIFLDWFEPINGVELTPVILIIKALLYMIFFILGFLLLGSFIEYFFPSDKYKNHIKIKEIGEDEEYVYFEASGKHIEPLSAKIRNKLSPYWNLIAMLKEYDKNKDEKILEYIMKEVKNIDDKKNILLELVDKVK